MIKLRWLVISVISTLVIYFLLSLLSPLSSQKEKAIIKELSLDLESKKNIRPAITERTKVASIKYTVVAGDSFYTIFLKHQIPISTLITIQQNKITRNFLRLRQSDKIELRYKNNALFEIDKKISKTKKIRYNLSEKKLTELDLYQKTEKRLVFTQGKVEDSLFIAGKKSGLSDQLIMNLIQIFAWDIDFNQDIRPGDHFNLLYERLYINGDFLETGQIIAAEYVNKSKIHQAFLYTQNNKYIGYYTLKGESLKKSFLRSPVAFSRISSKFSRKRYHPTLHKMRAHRGVDYAAPRGTPVKAAGNGTVIFKGYKNGYGRTVILKHANHFTTLYAHLNSYQRGLKKGKKIKQGQNIAYVGKSGTATGYHLHYEFRVNNKHKDPLKVRLPKAKRLNKKDLAFFKKQVEPVLLQLNALKHNLTPIR